MNVDDIVAAKVEAARRRIAADRERRARQKRARTAGLIQRYALKTALLNQLDQISNLSPAPSAGA